MKKTIALAALLFLVVLATSAYAEEVTAWQGFWNSTGGFLYNALPWNWPNWWGK